MGVGARDDQPGVGSGRPSAPHTIRGVGSGRRAPLTRDTTFQRGRRCYGRVGSGGERPDSSNERMRISMAELESKRGSIEVRPTTKSESFQGRNIRFAAKCGCTRRAGSQRKDVSLSLERCGWGSAPCCGQTSDVKGRTPNGGGTTAKLKRQHGRAAHTLRHDVRRRQTVGALNGGATCTVDTTNGRVV